MICTCRLSLDVRRFDKRENYGVIEKQALQHVNQNQSSCLMFPPSGLDKVMAFGEWRFSVSSVCWIPWLLSITCELALLAANLTDDYSVCLREPGSTGPSPPKHMSSSLDN